MKNKTGILTALLLAGMALMVPCYLFTAGNALFSPWTLYSRNRFVLAALTALCMAGLFFALRAVDRHEQLCVRHEKRMLIAAAVFYFAVQMMMGALLRYDPKTDAEQCFTAAKLIVDTGTFGNVERPWVYFTRYPFNLGFVYLLAGIFKFFGMLGWADRYMQAVLVNSLLFTAGLLCAGRAARRMGGAKAQAKLLALFASCLPFLYCTAELYTDSFSMAFPLISLYLLCRLRGAETAKARVGFAVLFALCAFAGSQVRFTAVVAVIACVIALVFEKRLRAAALAIVLSVAVMAAGAAMVDRYTYANHLTEEDVIKNELPRLHHIAMGLPVQPDEGYGQYGDGGWLIFSTSFEDPQERREALLSEVIDRVYYLRVPSRLIHMMSRKLISTFGDGTFMLNEIIQADAPQPDNAVKQVIFETGALYPAYYHLCTAMFVSHMLIACLACVQAVRKKATAAAPVFIALLGIFLVLCMWETRGRYFFQYQPVLLMAAAMLETGRAGTQERLTSL